MTTSLSEHYYELTVESVADEILFVKIKFKELPRAIPVSLKWLGKKGIHKKQLQPKTVIHAFVETDKNGDLKYFGLGVIHSMIIEKTPTFLH